MSNKYQVFDKEDPSIYTTPSPVASMSPQTLSQSSQTPSTYQPKTPYGIEFENNVREFLERHNNKVKVYILTPSYNGSVFIEYMTSLIQTISLFRDLNILLQVEFCQKDSLVTRSRNNLTARAMNDPDMTHVMFIDADINWTPDSIIKLLLAEKEIVCAIYPLKHYHFNRLLSDPMNPVNTNVVQTWIDRKNASQLRDFITDEQAIQYNLLRYNVNHISNTLEIEQNLCKIRHMATGFCLIKRTVFEKLFRSYPGLNYTDDVGFARPGEERYSFNIFDTGVEKMPDGKNHLLSEDFLFCERYRKIDPKNHHIYCDVSINLGHSGTTTYQGSFISSLL